MRPEALEESRDWLTRAKRDLLVAEQTLRVEPVLAEQVAFHSQQAAEKALKAFLTAHDRPIPRTHNLERLARLCRSVDGGFARFMPAARTLNPYVTQFRYPG